MKTSELRIGNLVNYNVGTYMFQGKVTTITGTRVVVDGVTSKFMNLYGVEITEEWLLKFGFEKKTGVFRKKFNEQIFAIGLDGSYGLYNDESRWRIGSSFCGDIKIKYVHQLQNLYFELTGEELTIKNK